MEDTNIIEFSYEPDRFFKCFNELGRVTYTDLVKLGYTPDASGFLLLDLMSKRWIEGVGYIFEDNPPRAVPAYKLTEIGRKEMNGNTRLINHRLTLSLSLSEKTPLSLEFLNRTIRKLYGNSSTEPTAEEIRKALSLSSERFTSEELEALKKEGIIKNLDI